MVCVIEYYEQNPSKEFLHQYFLINRSHSLYYTWIGLDLPYLSSDSSCRAETNTMQQRSHHLLLWKFSERNSLI